MTFQLSQRIEWPFILIHHSEDRPLLQIIPFIPLKWVCQVFRRILTPPFLVYESALLVLEITLLVH